MEMLQRISGFFGHERAFEADRNISNALTGFMKKYRTDYAGETLIPLA